MRISRHQMFLEIAQVVSKRSTCFREAVGAILVKNNKIISMGYNGAPHGEPHCTHHPDGKCSVAIHAEINAMLTIPQGMKGLDLYCTHLPCEDCMRAIIKSKRIKRVFFNVIYGDAKIVDQYFFANGIELYRVLNSGVITTPDRESICQVD